MRGEGCGGGGGDVPSSRLLGVVRDGKGGGEGDGLSCRVIVPSKSVKKMHLGLSLRVAGKGMVAVRVPRGVGGWQ